MGVRAGRTGLAVAITAASTLAPFAVAPAGAQDDGFRRGEAEASADTFTVNVKQGNANIGFTYGRSLANYRDRTASAEARALDLGVLPTLFAVDQCDGSTPPMNPDTLPEVTRVDSTESAAGRSRRVETFVPGTDGGPHGESAGFQDATASPAPASRGVTESADTDAYLLALEGGRTEVNTSLEGRVRTARAVSTADELRVFGGLFTFTNPRWAATARSGDVTTNEGTFTFDSATVLGVERTNEEALADFAEFEWGLEQLLAPFGVELDLPEVEVADGRVRVSPMAFRVVDPPFGSQVLAPFFGSIQPLREQANAQAIAEDCRNALAIMLLDVVLGVVAGSGAVEILAGGVEAWTADTDFSVEPLVPLPALGAEVLALPAEPLPPPAPLPPPPEPVAEPIVEAEPEEPEDDGSGEQAYLPVTPSSRFEDSDAGEAAVTVGIVALSGALVLTAGERTLARRRNRTGAEP